MVFFLHRTLYGGAHTFGRLLFVLRRRLQSMVVELPPERRIAAAAAGSGKHSLDVVGDGQRVCGEKKERP